MKKNDKDMKFKKNFKGKRQYSPDREKILSEKDGAHVSTTNDWRWYALDERLLRDSASYSYSKALGSQEDLGPYGGEVNNASVPGIMRIDICPTFGYVTNENDPINVAARNIYSYVRHANSGHANYDAPDLMIYLMAMDSAYMALAHFTRIYGIVNTYSVTNRYYPKGVVEALGCDFNNLATNLADFRAMLNVFAVKVGSLCVPASMSYMAKHMWMFSGLYRDINVAKAQTYAFSPAGFYHYDLDSDGAGYLGLEYYYPITSTDASTGRRYLLTMDDINKMLNDIINPILASEDMNIMSGDILKAYGENNIFKVSSVGETYTVIPAYDERVLDQIQNCSLIGLPWNTAWNEGDGHSIGDCALYQSPKKDYLMSKPDWHAGVNLVSGVWTNYLDSNTPLPGHNAFMADRYVTFEHGDVTPADTMEATRLCNIVGVCTDDEDPETHTKSLKNTSFTIGSEVACAATVYLYRREDGEWVLGDHGNQRMVEAEMIFLNERDPSVTSTEKVNYIADNLSRWGWRSADVAKFRRHPAFITCGLVAIKDTQGHVYKYDGYNGFNFDLNYYTTLGEQDLAQMSEVALLSMLKVTQYGKETEFGK